MAKEELQTIPARHGVATFVPANQVIKIVNTSGTQVVDTWAFALPKPDPKEGNAQNGQETKQEPKGPQAKKLGQSQVKKSADLPSQEEAEKATQEAQAKGEEAADGAAKKSGWSAYVPSSYVPSLGLGGGKKEDKSNEKSAGKNETEQQQNSRTWGQYFTAGKGFGSYIPQQATDTVSQFASAHQRDTSKSYLEQLTDFSKTPVGAAGWNAMTGSGYSGSLYAGYQAWNAKNAADAASMEFLSLTHSRAATLHLIPQVNDTLVTNVREPILTVVEDSSAGVHDTLIAACDPRRYKDLGVDKWEEHGSCAENLVLALKELNERAGLKGAKAVGADVTINNVPAPLNLFMNVPWDNDGDLGFKAPKSKKGDYIRLKAVRDVVVVMSACPQDVTDINGKNPQDAHFVVEDSEEPTKAIKRTAPAKKKVPARKPSATPSAGSTAQPKKKPIPSKTPPAKKPPNAVTNGSTAQPTAKPAPKPVQKAAPAQPAKTPAKPAAAPTKKPAPPTAMGTSGNAAPAAKKPPRKLTKPQAAE